MWNKWHVKLGIAKITKKKTIDQLILALWLFFPVILVMSLNNWFMKNPFKYILLNKHSENHILLKLPSS